MARGTAPCVARPPTTIRAVASGEQPAASASVWKCSTPPETTGSGCTAPEANPRRDPGDGSNESSSHRSRHRSIGRRRWRRVGHSSELSPPCPIAGSGSSSGEAHRRLFPVHRKAQEEGRGRKHSTAESSGVQASVRRRGGSCGESSRGFATRSGKIGHYLINGESIRWPSCEAVSAGGFRAQLRLGDAGMDAGASCRSPSGRCGRTSPRSGESFPAPHHCCSRVAGVDQQTVSCNAIFCCQCRHGAMTQFSSI